MSPSASLSRTRPRRYQLRKASVDILASGHPWLFRGQLSSAASIFRDGQWLALVDHENRVVGHGIYEASGAIAIRVLSRGPLAPDAAWVAERVDAALAAREPVRAETDGFRAVHGENDSLPAVVVDVYADTAVLLTYSAGAEALGRVAAAQVHRRLGLRRTIWRPGHRRAARGSTDAPARVLRGAPPDGPVAIREANGALELWVDPLAGQKGGAYLDLRGLRRWLIEQDLRGARVLDLFSYTGGLGLAAERAGAAEVWNVDASAGALAFSARHHRGDGPVQRGIEADVFDWLRTVPDTQLFDLVIADPPPMTSRMGQLERALAAYRRLYRAAGRLVRPGGRLIACCCTSRIDARRFRRAVVEGLGDAFRFERRLPHEIDHPVRFPEADYLKILVFSRAISGA